MNLIADILMAAGSFGAAIYCYVLSARLKKFTALENGMGSAIAVLSVQVDDMTKALEKARNSASGSATSLDGLTTRAESVAARIELLLASMHDLPDPGPRVAPPVAAAPEPEDDQDRKLRFIRRRSSRNDLEAAE
ncbi:hypothetical protein NX862_10415 [Rhodobacter sp. KR11]|uniref:hypothetical protein n=1 Tax=Rhodobacter sp. KR11 TaxID=2974588 RepID=UPI0022220BD5|nr:hypothetical protein [Rhodobacter sp. KR11]MCW1919173.1 hypothetical protein [Rhodobacter sp. KR11]